MTVMATVVTFTGCEAWTAEHLRGQRHCSRDSIDIDPEKRGGVPMVKGTRVPVATILAELAEGATIGGVAADLDLDPEILRKMIQGIAGHFDCSFSR